MPALAKAAFLLDLRPVKRTNGGRLASKDKRAELRRKRRRRETNALTKHLTEQEVAELGLNHKTGSDHYRAFVGRPQNYDLGGAVQFEFLFDLGMREYHRMLDIGCGSLRLGRHILPWLMPGRYYGLEPNRKIVYEGLMQHFGSGEEGEIVRCKRPSFTHNTDFDFSFVGEPVDFMMAHSIASHSGVKEIRKLFEAVASVSHDDTVAVVTYCRCTSDSDRNTEDGWFYPGVVNYTDDYVAELATEVGLKAARTIWPPGNHRRGGQTSLSQTPLILTKQVWKPTPAHFQYGRRHNPPVQLN